MITIEKTEVQGFEAAIRGMRNPKNSWGLSDSECLYTAVPNFEDDDPMAEKYSKLNEEYGLNFKLGFKLGEKDEDLCKRLNAGGPVHAKYRRMITVWCDITAPFYWWKEFDTYKVGTVADSCSTMHKLAAKEFELSDFSCENLLAMKELVPDDEAARVVFNDIPVIEVNDGSYWSPLGILKMTVIMLNKCRELYLRTGDKSYWWQMIQLLPSSYNQKRTVMLNYEVLANIWVSRKGHKLTEWHDFRKWISELPYSELITGDVEL